MGRLAVSAALLLGTCSTCGLVALSPLVTPSSARCIAAPRAAAVSMRITGRGKLLPPALIEWGCDEELWSRTKNKKGLLDLLKKGRIDDAKKRIQSLRKIVEDEDREALETKLFVLKSEGQMAVERRREMTVAYAAKAAAITSIEPAVSGTQVEGVAAEDPSTAVQAAPPAAADIPAVVASTPAGTPEDLVEVEERLAKLTARQTEQGQELERLKSDGETAIQQLNATRATVAAVQTAAASAQDRAAAAADSEEMPTAEVALVQAAVAEQAAAVAETAENAGAALEEGAEVVEDAARRAYKASPISAFLPKPPPSPSERRKADARSVEQRLAELDELLSLGMISEEEYDDLKPRLEITDTESPPPAQQSSPPSAPQEASSAPSGYDEVFKEELEGILAEMQSVVADSSGAKPDLSGVVAGESPGAAKGGEIEGVVYQGESSLAPALSRTLALLDLYDPTAMTAEEQDKAVGAIATGTAVIFPLFLAKFGFLPDLLFSAFVGGGLGGYCSLRKDVVGVFARDVVGGSANLAVFTAARRAREIEDEYEVTKDAQERLGRQIEQLIRLKDKMNEPR